MCSFCVPLSVSLVPALRQGVVHVFVVCPPVCWSCASITSGGSSCVRCVCPCLLALRQGVVHVFVLCAPVCWTWGQNVRPHQVLI